MSRIKLFGWIITYMISITVHAQEPQGETIVIGEKFPDLTLSKILNYPKSTVSINELKGQWLLLDFWSPTCGLCLKSLAELKTIKKSLGKELEIMLIAYEMRDKATEKTLDLFFEKYHVKFPVSIGKEPSLNLGISGVPYYILVNPQGFVVSKFYYQDLSEDYIRSKMSNISESKLSGNGSATMASGETPDKTDSLLYESSLQQWKKNSPIQSITHFSGALDNHLELKGYPLAQLYFLAYADTLYPYVVNSYSGFESSYGKLWYKPVLQVTDSSGFMVSPDSDKNLFSYSLTIPSQNANPLFMQKMMRMDLQKYFGYKVTVEKRKMPCWYLRADETARTKLKPVPGHNKHQEYFWVGFKYENEPVMNLIGALGTKFPAEPPFIDQTGIIENISIEINADLTEFKNIHEALSKYGLRLEKGTKEMKVIVIHDRDQSL